jgi:uridine kinase
LCSIDPLTQVDHSDVTVATPADGVLVVDGVFAFRPELDRAWDLRVWLEIAPELALQRATERDTNVTSGADEAARLTRDRSLAAERIYLAEVDPATRRSSSSTTPTSRHRAS